MTIVELLQSDDWARVSWADRWLDWEDGAWVVYSRAPYARRATIEYRGTDEAAAVAALKGGEE